VLLSDLSTHQEDRLVWTPDVLGSICFLVSGVLAYRVSTRPRTMAAVNLAGCVFFMISAIAAYVVPDTGSILDLAAANWNTALGAACFLAGSVMLARHQPGVTS
jgi:YrhK-like protein